MKSSLSAEEIYQSTKTSINWWENSVSRRLGAYLTLAFIRARLRPNTVSILALFSNAVASSIIIVLPSDANLQAGIVAFVGWQLTVSLDCADGSLARVTGQESESGAQIDLIGDYIGHFLVLAAVMARSVAGPTIGADVSAAEWSILVVAISGGWLVVLGQGQFRHRDTAVDQFASKGLETIRLGWAWLFLRQARDGTLWLAVLAIAMALGPYPLLAVISLGGARGWLFLGFKALLLLKKREGDQPDGGEADAPR